MAQSYILLLVFQLETNYWPYFRGFLALKSEICACFSHQVQQTMCWLEMETLLLWKVLLKRNFVSEICTKSITILCTSSLGLQMGMHVKHPSSDEASWSLVFRARGKKHLPELKVQRFVWQVCSPQHLDQDFGWISGSSPFQHIPC